MTNLQKNLKKPFTCAIVGATGMVGSMFLKILEERNLPIAKMYLFASSRSAGKHITWQGKPITVEELTPTSFIERGIDVALFGVKGNTSLQFAPLAVESGIIVVDNSSAWRLHENVPLVVPEVNENDIHNHKGIIANPNCCATPAVVALNPLAKEYGLNRVVISTYQSVSGAGMGGMEDLEMTIKGLPHQHMPHAIAYNIIPHIDTFDNDGYTGEERKLMSEICKMLHLPNLPITATSVRVPVKFGHSLSINVALKKPFVLEDIKNLLSNSAGIILYDKPKDNIYPMPIIAAGTDNVYVGRIRKDTSCENALNMWVSVDNTRKGAATNAIQIIETLLA